MNCGKVENLQNFDADFFKIPPKHANYMDPQLRKLLEVAFEAIVDAGKLIKISIKYSTLFIPTKLNVLT